MKFKTKCINVKNYFKISSKDLPEDDYIELKTDLEVKKENIKKEIALLESDDAEFEVILSTILDIVSRAYEVFKSSELDEKRRIINILFPNLEMNQEKLVFTIRKPLDTLLNLGESPLWLPETVITRTKEEEIYISNQRQNVLKNMMSVNSKEINTCAFKIESFRERFCE